MASVYFPSPKEMDEESERAAAMAKVMQAEARQAHAQQAHAQATVAPQQTEVQPKPKVTRRAEAPARRDERRDYGGYAPEQRRDQWGTPDQRRDQRGTPDQRRGWGFAGEPTRGGYQNWF